MKSDEIFILPAETLRIVRAAEAEWAEASAAFEAARIRRLTTVRDAYAAVIGIAPGSIILASGKARRPVGPMLAVEVDVRRADRRIPDSNEAWVSVIAKRLTAHGTWAVNKEYISEWEPYTGDRSELPPIPPELLED